MFCFTLRRGSISVYRGGGGGGLFRVLNPPVWLEGERVCILAEAAAYIMCFLLREAGYFVNLAKSQSAPSTSIRFLGFICDSRRQAFIIPDDKRVKFKSLREAILSSRDVNVRTLQRFAGKAISFSLEIPGCKLYVREVFKAISFGGRSSRPTLRPDGEPRAEILYWCFLDDWPGFLPWRSEHHTTVSLCRMRPREPGVRSFGCRMAKGWPLGTTGRPHPVRTSTFWRPEPCWMV